MSSILCIRIHIDTRSIRVDLSFYEALYASFRLVHIHKYTRRPALDIQGRILVVDDYVINRMQL